MGNKTLDDKVADLRNKLTPLYNLAAIMNEIVINKGEAEFNDVIKNCINDANHSLPIIRKIVDSLLVNDYPMSKERLKSISQEFANNACMPYCWEDVYNRLIDRSALPFKIKVE